MKNVEGILAVSVNNVIGQGSHIPWQHSGDFKRFRRITMGHGILMGFPTFVGIATKYTKAGSQVLPGRDIFIVGREPFKTASLSVDLSNVTFVPTEGPRYDILTAQSKLAEGQKLFIGGGGKIYRDYLPFAERVHLTTIMFKVPTDENTIVLYPETIELISYKENWRSVISEGSESAHGLVASYSTLDALI